VPASRPNHYPSVAPSRFPLIETSVIHCAKLPAWVTAMRFRRCIGPTLILAALQFVTVPTCRAEKLDKYGGVMEVACSKGPAPHFYTQKIGDRWWVCDPAGNGFFMKGVVGVNYALSATWATGALQSKYGSASNPYVASTAEDSADVWGFNYVIEQVNRLRAWGFNFLADGAIGTIWPTSTDVRWNTPDHTIPDQYKMPFDFGSNTTRYAMLPQIYSNPNCSSSLPLKNMMNGIGPTFSAWPYTFADYFDPNFSTCISGMWNTTNTNNELAAALGQAPYGAPHGDYLAYIYLDESDQTGFLAAGPTFPTISNSGLPDNPVSASAHAAWVALTTAPTQSSATVLGYATTYSNKEIYSKVQFANDMANRYLCSGSGTPLACCSGNQTGTCSVDPASSSYIGSSEMSTAKNALNSAWGSNYTTLSTSDSHCSGNLAACLQGGTYASWGTGTGLLDENGTCGGSSSCWVGNDITLVGETTTMQADMSAFLTHYVDQYFSVMTGWIHTYAPGVLTEMNIGGFGTPPRAEVLEAAGKYVDLAQLTVPEYCPTCTDTQQRIDFVARYLGDKPWMMWESFYANPDSAESAYTASNVATTQEGRGSAYQVMMNDMLNAESTTYSDFPVVGFLWWELYDAQNLNEGLCTPSDNPYDGKSAVIASGVDQWGYRTGGEANNYGDFLSDVTSANNGAIESMPR
jgi:hypothetical protein